MRQCGTCVDWRHGSGGSGECWSGDRLDGDMSKGPADRTRHTEVCEAWFSRNEKASDMPASMNTDSRRKASAAYHAKRAAAGLKKVTLWLSPEAQERLAKLGETYGSKDAAADAAIKALDS